MGLQSSLEGSISCCTKTNRGVVYSFEASYLLAEKKQIYSKNFHFCDSTTYANAFRTSRDEVCEAPRAFGVRLRKVPRGNELTTRNF
jgi:hypothetical protein